MLGIGAGAAAAQRGSPHPQPVHVCSCRSILVFVGASNCFLALVLQGLVLTAGVSVTASGFVGAMGSVGITILGGWFSGRK